MLFAPISDNTTIFLPFLIPSENKKQTSMSSLGKIMRIWITGWLEGPNQVEIEAVNQIDNKYVFKG